MNGANRTAAAARAALPVLLAAAVLVPLWAWSPFVLEDARLDGGLLAGLALAAALAALLAGALRPAPGTLPFLLALGAGAAGLLLPPDPELHAGLARHPPPWGGLADRMPWLSAWALACAAASLPGVVGPAARWILAGAAAAAWYGILQIGGADPLRWRPDAASPPTAPLSNTNAAAEILAVATVAAAARLRAPFFPREPARWRALLAYGLALVPMAFLAGHVDVLAAWLSLPAGLLWVALRDRRKIPACLLLGAAFLAGDRARAALDPAWARPALAASAPEVEAPAPVVRHPTIAARAHIYAACLERIGGAPLGIGLGRFETDYPWWRPAAELRLSSAGFRDPAVPRPLTPHSEPLLAFLELGWAGAALVALALWRLLKRRDRARWTDPALLVLGLHALVRSPLTENPAALALGALLAGWSARTLAPSSIPSRRPGAAAIALLAAVAAVPGALQVGGETAVAARVEALAAGAEADPAPLRLALRWRPWDAVAADWLAADLGRQGAPPAEVRSALERALAHDPADLKALTARLRLESASPDADPAAVSWALEMAERLYPEHPVVRENRTVWLEAEAARLRAEAVARLEQGRPRAEVQALLEAQHLLRALASIRRGDGAACRAELEEAAVLAGPERLRIERFARGSLEEPAVRDVVAQLLPDYAARLGPAPTGPPAAPSR